MRSLAIVFAAVIGAGTASVGLCQHPAALPPPPALAAIRGSVSYQDAVSGVYQGYEGGLASHCAKIDLDPASRVVKVLGKLQTDAQGNIVEGHWKETAKGVACGQTRTYNASVTVHEGKPRVLSLFPGHSNAGVQLQRDAVAYAATGAQAAKGCAFDVLDTNAQDGDEGETHLPWIEKWTVEACGKRSIVTLHFVPDSNGTRIDVSLRETVAAQ